MSAGYEGKLPLLYPSILYRPQLLSTAGHRSGLSTGTEKRFSEATSNSTFRAHVASCLLGPFTHLLLGVLQLPLILLVIYHLSGRWARTREGCAPGSRSSSKWSGERHGSWRTNSCKDTLGGFVLFVQSTGQKPEKGSGWGDWVPFSAAVTYRGHCARGYCGWGQKLPPVTSSPPHNRRPKTSKTAQS